jgi:hypothetical protein
MADQTPKPKEVTLEDIQRELGHDKMAFFSEMVRPDQHVEREEDNVVPTGAQTPPAHTPQEEHDIIETLEKYLGHKPTQQQINLALKQAAQF